MKKSKSILSRWYEFKIKPHWSGGFWLSDSTVAVSAKTKKEALNKLKKGSDPKFKDIIKSSGKMTFGTSYGPGPSRKRRK